MIRISKVDDYQDRIELFKTDDMELLVEWAYSQSNTELSNLAHNLKTIRDSGKEVEPGTTRLAPDLEIEIR